MQFLIKFALEECTHYSKIALQKCKITYEMDVKFH